MSAEQIDAEKLEELIKAAHACRDCGATVLKISDFWPLVDAARAHLSTLPRVKEVEVWRVEYAVKIGGVWQPRIATCPSEDNAKRVAEDMHPFPKDYGFISLIGPYKQKVPA